MPALATGNLAPTSLLGSRETIGMTQPNRFSLNSHWRYENWQRHTLRQMYNGSTWLHEAGVPVPADGDRIRVEVDPTFAEDATEFLARLPFEPEALDGGALFR